MRGGGGPKKNTIDPLRNVPKPWMCFPQKESKLFQVRNKRTTSAAWSQCLNTLLPVPGGKVPGGLTTSSRSFGSKRGGCHALRIRSFPEESVLHVICMVHLACARLTRLKTLSIFRRPVSHSSPHHLQWN